MQNYNVEYEFDLEYFDQEFEQYAAVTTWADLPSGNQKLVKLRVVANQASEWHRKCQNDTFDIFLIFVIFLTFYSGEQIHQCRTDTKRDRGEPEFSNHFPRVFAEYSRTNSSCVPRTKRTKLCEWVFTLSIIRKWEELRVINTCLSSVFWDRPEVERVRSSVNLIPQSEIISIFFWIFLTWREFLEVIYFSNLLFHFAKNCERHFMFMYNISFSCIARMNYLHT